MDIKFLDAVSDMSSREMIFLTYAQIPNQWRRVTVSYDYRHVPTDSLEFDLQNLHHLKDKECSNL